MRLLVLLLLGEGVVYLAMDGDFLDFKVLTEFSTLYMKKIFETCDKGEKRVRPWVQWFVISMAKVQVLNTRRCLGRRVCTDGSGGGHGRRRRARAKRGIRLECCRGR